jgi:DNA-binding transcriptional MocR family regulator
MSSPVPPGSTTLDDFTDRYAARTRGMTASEIRALFAVANRPEIVSLAGGMPNLAALPLNDVAVIIGDLVAQQGTAALQYCGAQGDAGLREHICTVMALEGIDAHPDDIVITVGAQEGLDLLARIFLDPGDVVLAEGPSYVGALGVFAAAEARVLHVAMDGDGLRPDALQEKIDFCTRNGAVPKFLYTVPSFQNPAGVTQTPERRAEVLAVAQRNRLLVIEDNPYGLLGFDGEPTPALRAHTDRGVIYLGSFSKTFAPGLRVGWVYAPPAVRSKLVLAAESQTLCPPTFSQMAVRAYLENHDWQRQIKTYREMYRERRDAMLETLAAVMPAGSTWTRPAGGFFVWATVPEGIDTKAMMPRAIHGRVAYVPGTGFFADGTGGRHMRLSFCFPEPDRIREGVRRLAGVLEEELELRTTFGPAGETTPRPASPFGRSDAPSPETR